MDNLYRYRGYTLIDITPTGQLTSENPKARNQQRNWETVNQILSLRAQLLEFNYLGVKSETIDQHSFGVNYQGAHNVWSFEFAVERDDIYSFQHDRYGTLKNDFAVTPIVLGLDETIKPNIPLFYASGPEKNIYFITIQN